MGQTNNRILKVSETGDFFRKRTKPVITLSGKWLQQAGFAPGSKVIVEVVENQLTIKPEETAKPA